VKKIKKVAKKRRKNASRVVKSMGKARKIKGGK
jgi:hypothetical protein